MSKDAQEANEEWRRRRRRRLRIVLVAFFVLLMMALGAAFLAVRNLDLIAKWTLEALFPNIRVTMKSLKFPSFERLEVRNLTFVSADDGSELLKVDSGTAIFTFDDVRLGRIGEIRLDRPFIRVSPAIGAAFRGDGRAEGSSPAAAEVGLPVSIGRIRVRDGRLLVTKFDAPSPEVALEFWAHLRDVGTTEEMLDTIHEIDVRNVTANAAGRNDPFLKIAEGRLRFTTRGMFRQQWIHGVEAARGDLTLSRDLFDSSGAPKSAARSAPPQNAAAKSTPAGKPWTLGAVRISQSHVRVDKGVTRGFDAAFDIEAQLAGVPLAASPPAEARDEQSVTLQNLRIVPAGAKEPAASAARLAMRFSIPELLERRVREVRLVEPDVTVTGDLIKSFADLTASPAPAASHAPSEEKDNGWSVAQLVTDYGTIQLRDLGQSRPDVSLKFAFDLKDVATAGPDALKAHEVVAWDIQNVVPAVEADPFLTVDVAKIVFTPEKLLREMLISEVNISRGRLKIGRALEVILAGESAAAASTSSSAQPAGDTGSGWKLGKLSISGVRTRLDDPRPEVSDIAFTLNTTLTNVELSQARTDILEEVQLIEFANLVIRSPVNREARIFTLRSVFVRFSLAGIARRHLHEVVLVRPVIYLNQDLFLYMERAQQPSPSKPGETTSPAAGWTIDRFQVKLGSLVLGGSGERNIGLPLTFETLIENIALDNLAKLKLKAALRVPKQSYDLASYQLKLRDVEGDMHFSYPPEKGQNNLVQKLDIRQIRWRQFRSDKAWIAVTFDTKGINGEFGGEAYNGYATGGFSFLFNENSPWIGWVGGKEVDMKKLTDVISPQNFQLTGPLEFRVQTDAFGRNIERVKGDFSIAANGKLRIGKLDDLIANIPATWGLFKQTTTRIALETLRDFDYTKAAGDFWFVNRQGILNLNLSGPYGSRNFEVVAHRDRGGGRWAHKAPKASRR